MKKVNIQSIPRGGVFTYGGIQWARLQDTEEGSLCITNTIIEERAFDTENYNDWNKSSLKKYLNTEFLNKLCSAGADSADFADLTQDLTSDDGLGDYEESTDKISLITCDQYRTLRAYIPPADDWWWTITPWSCNASGSCYVRSVFTGGALDLNYAYFGGRGVRPLCNLKSGTTVETDDDSVLDDAPESIKQQIIENAEVLAARDAAQIKNEEGQDMSRTDYYPNGELVSLNPAEIAAALQHLKPAAVSVRDSNGEELTITDMTVRVRPNGIHLLLDAPEAYRCEE